VNIRIGHSDWSKSSAYDAIFTMLISECNIFEAWLLSSPPLPSRQVNMADSCWTKFRLFGRHLSKSM